MRNSRTTALSPGDNAVLVGCRRRSYLDATANGTVNMTLDEENLL
jgi:hypothetical protein